MTLVDLLDRAASDTPDRGYGFLPDGEGDVVWRTFGELRSRADAIAAELSSMLAPGSRVVLLHPPGLEFLDAFFGVVAAGAVAVPVAPPIGDLEAWLGHFDRLVANAEPDLVLTTDDLVELRDVAGLEVGPSRLQWLAAGALPTQGAGAWSRPLGRADDAAMIQYTSGSTAHPKGVKLTHANLVANQHALVEGFGLDPSSVVVSWLPMFHDMGLIGCILHPLYQGCTAYLLPSLHFLQRPARWLEAISRFGGTCSGGPNFAYELCVKRVGPEEAAALDLRSWSVAFSGAEPVRARTIRRFAEAFSPAGFDPCAFVPCYGLAESSLFVSGARASRPPRVVSVDRADLEKGRAVQVEPGPSTVELVSMGRTAAEHAVVVVDPATGHAQPPGQVGEIWVTGPSVAAGYWHQPEETATTFEARLATGEGPYLRTGDLGFSDDGDLFVSGRQKEMIIVRGRNFYPHDLEDVVQQADARFRAGCGVAFAVDTEQGEEVVIVQETAEEDPSELEILLKELRVRVTDTFQVPLAAAVLVPPRTLPKTSSGKLRRIDSRRAYLAGELPASLTWSHGS